ncbi:MAG: DNA methyltransferase [Gammaproteobacteria bacterium]|nr:DNA methyltransferase [Gammaproteobacteria bacterium]
MVPPLNWKPRTIWTADCLYVLRGMNSASVDLIYLDPPFNSKADYAAPIGSIAAGAAFRDTWSLSDVDAEWINLMEARHPALYRVLLAAMTDSDKAYLAYMAARILEMRRVLKPTGSIYLHCDDTASAYLRLVMDAVFGRGNFRNEIVWKRIGNHNDAGRFGRTNDRLLFYGAPIRRDAVRVPLTDANVSSKYRHRDGRGRYRKGDLTGPGVSQGEAGREWGGWNPTSIGRCWSVPRTGDYAAWIDRDVVPGYLTEPSILARLDMLHEAGLIAFTRNGTPELKRYLAANPGQVPPDVWTDIPPVNSQARERVGYPTQKPLALLDRIIRASSDPGDMVLDPFCGCATTCVAAHALDRKWTGIDLSPKAADLVVERIRGDVRKAQGEVVQQGRIWREIIHRTDLPRRTDLGPLPHPRTHKTALYGIQSGDCAGCREHFHARNLEVDHIIAREKGGTDHAENLQLLCGHCNRTKGDRGMEYLRAKLQLR